MSIIDTWLLVFKNKPGRGMGSSYESVLQNIIFDDWSVKNKFCNLCWWIIVTGLVTPPGFQPTPLKFLVDFNVHPRLSQMLPGMSLMFSEIKWQNHFWLLSLFFSHFSDFSSSVLSFLSIVRSSMLLISSWTWGWNLGPKWRKSFLSLRTFKFFFCDRIVS